MLRSVAVIVNLNKTYTTGVWDTVAHNTTAQDTTTQDTFKIKVDGTLLGTG